MKIFYSENIFTFLIADWRMMSVLSDHIACAHAYMIFSDQHDGKEVSTESPPTYWIISCAVISWVLLLELLLSLCFHFSFSFLSLGSLDIPTGSGWDNMEHGGQSYTSTFMLLREPKYALEQETSVCSMVVEKQERAVAYSKKTSPWALDRFQTMGLMAWYTLSHETQEHVQKKFLKTAQPAFLLLSRTKYNLRRLQKKKKARLINFEQLATYWTLTQPPSFNQHHPSLQNYPQPQPQPRVQVPSA